jgi:acetate kinase
MAHAMKILVANIGSTSFKYRLFGMPDGVVLAEGRTERIGQGGECPDYRTAIERTIGSLVGHGKPLATLRDLSAVGFKTVHARALSGTQAVTDEVLRAMEAYDFLAPAHNPPYVAAMRAFREAAPDVPAVALFETAFFDSLPDAVTTYAVPYEWRERWHVRRYGFHGASHRYASERAQALKPKAALRHLSCHLGGSSSVAAIKDGVAVNISFGMSPQAGLPQNNRAGDLDVFAVLFLMKEHGFTVDQMAAMLASQSGLAGISGLSGDVRDLTEAADAGNRRARLALDVFVEAVRHYLGAFLLQLGGVDVLTFSGGIGERAGRLRSGICRGLEAFGIQLADTPTPAGGAAAKPGEIRISAEGAPVDVWVIPTNEEWIVARAAAEWLAAGAGH